MNEARAFSSRRIGLSVAEVCFHSSQTGGGAVVHPTTTSMGFSGGAGSAILASVDGEAHS